MSRRGSDRGGTTALKKERTTGGANHQWPKRDKTAPETDKIPRVHANATPCVKHRVVGGVRSQFSGAPPTWEPSA